ncbi:hypothetical protein Thiowin_03331 [Thiorhodovibrio winogradskyi]|uniref:DUF4304 domain-containing protein n=1 Tax=Thiorhodovibrio winogradskyi TaxID=77007 RepID=A0ABZ0SF50_9GAMM|nr:DUF4304 domain-containing protein [Thiorhodovibrio winogradskyi]
MSEISKKIDEIINMELKALMKANGFKKNARNFYKELEGGVFLLVNVQGSMYNDNQDARYTVNLGVFFPEIYEMVGFGNVGSVPSIPDCSVSKRIGQLKPERTDYWWQLTPASDFNQLAADLSESVEQYGLPWLRNNSSITSASVELKGQNPFTAAATAIIEGNRCEAAEIINKVISKGSAAKSRAISWGKK